MMRKGRKRVFKPKHLSSDVQSQLVCLRIRQNAAITVDPNAVDVVNVQLPINTSGLDVDEYNAFRARVYGKYQKFRFAGCSFTLQRSGDKTLVATAYTNATVATYPPHHTTLSIVNQRACRLRTVNDAYTVLNSVEVNDVGMDRVPNVRNVHFKPVKLAKYVVPNSIKMNKFNQVNLNTMPEATTAVPAPFLDKSPRNLVREQYSFTEAAGTDVGTSNIPNRVLMQADIFPRTPVPGTVAGDANPIQVQTNINFTVFKNFYFECMGIDANGVP